MGESEKPKKSRQVTLPVTRIQAELYGEDDPKGAVQRALDRLKDPFFQTNVDLQVAALNHVHELWGTLEGENQALLVDGYSIAIPRCQRSSNPAKTFLDLNRLTDMKDRERALRVGESKEIPWVPTTGEDIYPTEGFLGRYLEYAKHNGSHLAFHFWSAIAILGALAHRSIYIDAGQFYIFLNNYIILTGASDSGKSIAMGIAQSLAERYNILLLKTYRGEPHSRSLFQVSGDITVPALVKTLGNQSYSYTDRATGVIHKGQKDATGLMMVDEIANFLSQDAHGARLKVPFLTGIYHGNRYEKATNKDGVLTLEKPALSMLALGAPEWFRGNITEDFRQGGLLDRVMFVHREATPRLYTIPLNPLDPTIGDDLAHEMLGLVQMGHIRMRPDPGGQLYFDSWYTERHKDLLKRGLDAKTETGGRSLNRTTGVIQKVAAILAWTSGLAPHISDEHFEMAKNIVLVENESILKLLAVVDESYKATVFDEIIQYIAGQGGCSQKTAITNKFYRRKYVSDTSVDSFLAVLISAGKIREIPKGRSCVYALTEHEECLMCRPLDSGEKIIRFRKGA